MSIVGGSFFAAYDLHCGGFAVRDLSANIPLID